MKYDISVETKIARQDGTLYADLGVFYWPNVDEEIRTWFAGSCSLTARWLVALPECTGESYIVQYRTIIADTETGKVKSDTSLVGFENLSYRDVIRFERWALDQLDELTTLFERKRDASPEVYRPRNKIKAWTKILFTVMGRKLGFR